MQRRHIRKLVVCFHCSYPKHYQSDYGIKRMYFQNKYLNSTKSDFEPLFSVRIVDKLWRNRIPADLESFNYELEFIQKVVGFSRSWKLRKQKICLEYRFSNLARKFRTFFLKVERLSMSENLFIGCSLSQSGRSLLSLLSNKNLIGSLS